MSNRIRQLQEMGFTEEVARRVLGECVWDVNTAIDRLLQCGVPSDEKPPPLAAEAWRGASTPASSSTTASATSTPRSLGRSSAPSPAAAPRPAARDEEAVSLEAASRPAAREEEAVKAPETAAAREEEAVAAPEAVVEVDSSEPRAEVEHPQSARSPDASEVGEHPAAQEAAAEASPAEPAALSLPRKRIERVETPWQAQDDTQMAAARGDFVRVWAEHGTLNGWVYAEAMDGAAAGWLPAFSLQALPKNQRWLFALRSCVATHSTQRDVEEGSVLLVNMESSTDVGWVFADALERGDVAGGWVPMNCLEQLCE